MKPSKITALLASFAIGSCLLVPATAAEALGDSSCPNNRVCVWDYRNFETSYLGVFSQKGIHHYRTPYVGPRLNDKISSYSIGHSTGPYKYVMFYEHAYNPAARTGTGNAFYDKNGNRYAEMHRLSHPDGHRNGWEDKVSSFDEAN